MKKIGLNLKLNIYIVSAFIVVFGITLGVIINYTNKNAERNAKDFARVTGGQLAKSTQGYLDQALNTSKALVDNVLAMQEIGHTDRELVLATLKQSMKANPNYFGLWSMWEPNAFDGKDDVYAKRFGQEIGLFNASCYSEGGRLHYQNYGTAEFPAYVSDDDDAHEYAEPYYIEPKTTLLQHVGDPSQYSFSGKDEDLETTISLVTPIVKDNKFLGVFGVDLDFRYLVEINKDVKIFETGFAAIITHNNIVAAHPNTAYVAGKIDTIFREYNQEIEECIKNGKEYAYTAYSGYGKGEVLRVFSPVRIGDSDKPWAIMIDIPIDEITAEARQMSINILFVGIMGLLLILILVFLLQRV